MRKKPGGVLKNVVSFSGDWLEPVWAVVVYIACDVMCKQNDVKRSYGSPLNTESELIDWRAFGILLMNEWGMENELFLSILESLRHDKHEIFMLFFDTASYLHVHEIFLVPYKFHDI